MSQTAEQVAPDRAYEEKEFDYRNPDYIPIMVRRIKREEELREAKRHNPDAVVALKDYYKERPWEYITDWGMTFDPRLLERGEQANMPFILWPRQVEYLKWVYAKWKNGERGLVEKSRDCGVTWLSAAMAVAMLLFIPGFACGFGSRKEELVDKKGNPDCIFEKIRHFYKFTPEIFIPKGYEARFHSGHMKLLNPETGGSITGEAGDNIGRGGRKAIYFVDEAAFIDHQDAVDNALSQTTNCQIDISTPNGNGNAFYKKRMRFNNTSRIFVFDWRDDPRKDEAWYNRQCEELDEVTIAQEIDRDYNASQEDVFIPAKWVRSAIDAHKRLGIEPSGIRSGGFDPADVGDAKAVVCRHGSVITGAWQKTSGDITQAIPWAFDLADKERVDALGYDADGMGAPAMKMALTKMSAGRMRLVAYHGSAGVSDPDKAIKTIKLQHQKLMEGKTSMSETVLKTNHDTYRNFRSQTWTWVRNRFEATHRAVEAAKQGHIVTSDPDELISIDSRVECFDELVAEISRPMRIWTENGKILVESKKHMRQRGVDSPNLADALIIAFAMTPKVQKKSEHKYTFETYGPAMDGII